MDNTDLIYPPIETLRTSSLPPIDRVGKNEYLTTTEVAEVYGVHEASVHYWLSKKLLHSQPAAKGARHIELVRPDDIHALLLRRSELGRDGIHHAKPTMLDVSSIISAPELQMRERMCNSAVKTYAEIQAAGPMDAIVVFRDIQDDRWHYVADGFHRLEAARRLGRKTILAAILPGGREAALRFALGANARTGVPRTNADKRKAVCAALDYYALNGGYMSNRQIAAITGVSSTFVDKVVRYRGRPLAQRKSRKAQQQPPPAMTRILEGLSELRQQLELQRQTHFAQLIEQTIAMIAGSAPAKNLDPA